jgi:hypothetical protein
MKIEAIGDSPEKFKAFVDPAAVTKTEREPPRPRSDVQLVSYFMMKKAILTRGQPSS